MLLSDTRFMIPIIAHELCTQACSTVPERLTVASPKCRLYRVSVPPDQLNPGGYYDGVLSADFLQEKKVSTRRVDLRASAKQIQLPPAGMSSCPPPKSSQNTMLPFRK